MIVELLLLMQLGLTLILIKAVRGPEIIYHRRKRWTLFIERIYANVAAFIERLRSPFRKGD